MPDSDLVHLKILHEEDVQHRLIRSDFQLPSTHSKDSKPHLSLSSDVLGQPETF